LGKEEVAAGMKAGAVRGGWETPEERAAKQIYIVRQSSISNAIAFYGMRADHDKDVLEDDVISLAKRFEAYVFGNDPKEPNEVE